MVDTTESTAGANKKPTGSATLILTFWIRIHSKVINKLENFTDNLDMVPYRYRYIRN
jgi:hypothetical protein